MHYGRISRNSPSGPPELLNVTLVEQVRRWWAHRKLRRGQCRVCRAALRDDEQSRYCSDDCYRADAY